MPDLDQTPGVHGGEEWHLGPELVAVAIQEDSGGSAHGGDQVESPFGESGLEIGHYRLLVFAFVEQGHFNRSLVKLHWEAGLPGQFRAEGSRHDAEGRILAAEGMEDKHAPWWRIGRGQSIALPPASQGHGPEEAKGEQRNA